MRAPFLGARIELLASYQFTILGYRMGGIEDYRFEEEGVVFGFFLMAPWAIVVVVCEIMIRNGQRKG